MKKKLLFILLIIICMITNVSAHEQFDDGWHTVKTAEKTEDCKLNYVWGYYKNGVEKVRQCRQLIAHRGWGTAPENSLAAFKETKANGFYGFELDVRFTKDNVPVVLHDATIERVARKKGDINSAAKNISISNITLKELNDNYVFPVTRTGKVLEKYKDNKITKFEDVVKYAKENGMYIGIELKVGTKEQIASVVKIVQKYKMDNQRVRWISFSPILLSYINLVDDNERLGLLNMANYTNNCDVNNENIFCGTDAERVKYHKLLDTKNNYVYLDGDPSPQKSGQGNSSSVNLPDRLAEYPESVRNLSTIKQGVITISNSITVGVSKSIALSYEYSGDGTVKCVSSDKSYVTCKVNETDKTITIKGVKAKTSVKVNVYATQGTKVSATKDYTVTVKVTSSSTTTSTPKPTNTPKPNSTSTSKPSVTNTPKPTSVPASIKGDVDGNGIVGSSDYILVKKHILNQSKLDEDKLKKADVNQDGKITSADYIMIKKIIIDAK